MLTAADILDLVDAGANCSPAPRATLMVAAAMPALSKTELAALPIGSQNTIILQARRAALGEDLASRAACPACGEALEFTLGASELLAQASANMAAEPFHVSYGELMIVARLPAVGDLLAIEREAGVEAAQHMLLTRCVIEAHVQGDQVATNMLPKAAIAALAAAIRARDPLVETSVEMRCPACTHTWQAALDIAAFVWHEFSALAERIAGEVDMLARTYGWSEHEILALSARRRRRYLDMIEA